MEGGGWNYYPSCAYIVLSASRFNQSFGAIDEKKLPLLSIIYIQANHESTGDEIKEEVVNFRILF